MKQRDPLFGGISGRVVDKKNNPNEIREMMNKILGKVDPLSLPNIICSDCGYFGWDTIQCIKKVSSLISPDGKEHILPYDVLICHKCGKIVSENLVIYESNEKEKQKEKDKVD